MKKELIQRILSSIVLISLIIFCVIKGTFYINLLILITFLISLYEWYNMRKNNFLFFFGAIYLGYTFYSVYKIIDYNNSYFYFLFIILICVSSDIGGFIIGKLFKGPKLIKISPNKTYSGSIGSYLFSLLITLFFLTNTNYGFDTQFSITTYTVVLVILGSTVSQIGDLVISYFKRMSKIKNTGNLIPGHGGILDRIDGMIFTFPFFYTLLIINDFRLN
ncbi:phosphatidate cytidylyltransferase [Pelagibacterales bacterium SAG-MED22]|nr:phosphatidate cytidylyltransferase [Pelagibacterales bacterium SAG-MED22]